MTYKLSEITQKIGLDLQGNDINIDGIHTLSEAISTQLSFFNSEKYLNQLPQTKAAAVFIAVSYTHLTLPTICSV